MKETKTDGNFIYFRNTHFTEKLTLLLNLDNCVTTSNVKTQQTFTKIETCAIVRFG